MEKLCENCSHFVQHYRRGKEGIMKYTAATVYIPESSIESLTPRVVNIMNIIIKKKKVESELPTTKTSCEVNLIMR